LLGHLICAGNVLEMVPPAGSEPRLVRLTAVILTLWFSAGSAVAAPELIEIPAAGSSLKAYLYRPAGSGPFPAIVALHDCGGVSGPSGPVARRYRDWGERLSAAGFAVLFPDSFGSRGLTSQCRVRERPVRTARERVNDAVAARHWLQA